MSKVLPKNKTETGQRREAMVGALNKMLEIFCSHTKETFEEVLSKALHPVADLIGADRIVVYHYVKISQEKHLMQMYSWDRAEDKMPHKSISYLPNTPVITGWVKLLLKNQFLNKRLCDMSESEVAFSHIFGIQSLLMLPIFMRGDFWGGVAFQNHKSEQLFDENCIDLLRSASHLCANAVMRTEMQDDIADKNETNRVMFNSAPIGLTIFDSKYKCLDCNKAVLQMYGISKRQYLNNFFYLSPEYQPDGSRSIDKQFEMMKRTINGEKIKAEWMHRSLEGELIPCEITMVRMRIKGKYFGLGYAYDLRHIKKLEQNIQWLESEVDKIYYDPLTGIFNRRYFDMNLQRLVKSFARSGGSFSFMMVDIDRFKRYNDSYGHREGDNCLIRVAETLVNCVMRADDFVARYGGEEFAVVLPNTDESGARQVAEKLLEGVRDCKLPHEYNDGIGFVTISIGVTTGYIDQSTNGDDFIKRADEMLYESKQSGRNKYSFAPL